MGLPATSLSSLSLSGGEPALPSGFAVGTAAQVTIGAAALAAAEIGHARTGRRQTVKVDMTDAAAECTGYFTLDGETPAVWAKLSGLYPCGSAAGEAGWVRIHANFDHHRDAALHVLGLPSGDRTERPAVERALRNWSAEAFETAAADAGAVVAAARTFAAWDVHPQGVAVAGLPLVSIDRLGDAEPLHWDRQPRPEAAPLEGVRVLDMTRILAGPVCGRTLAGYGADVLLLNSPRLPNIEAIADTSRGKRSAHLDLTTSAGRDVMRQLVRDADVCLQGYRPGAMEAMGFGPRDLASLNPGIVCVSLSAWGHVGPWAGRRGFDSIVQTAAGFNHAEAEAAGDGRPKPLPVQILDYASGFLMAFAAQAALLRRAQQGGSWQARVALATTAHWLRSLGRVEGGLAASTPDVTRRLQAYQSGFGALEALPHAACFDETPVVWRRPSMPPGSDAPQWTP